MILTERETPKGLLVSVCDRDVLGETFENGEVSITVSEEFYGGEEAETAEVATTLARASVANLVGERAVSLAIEEGHVEEANVLEIDGTPHAQFLRM
ncbi:DUF424 domain-containing protein [Halalkalicoccus jeotgali]|uniref:DUF424 domain-containing protein n=1 Tax=Halalkalicoccus jeotgali (strain DSM 18796 / CECT 7217 / JCM 14584 / KCTC 4019 / B3) TaxID=795797 RepID=D8J589_HALJB|nr:DUF424 family protein [Halalkalicoccus jeotgali]ADJ13670.1 hypothetical protein HacjB3_01385 [Halalkalicoccus jeotgali B3]ELY34283.1 hypothetical protein C497_17937 [Halalkalicoccus jeotgali B3]